MSEFLKKGKCQSPVKPEIVQNLSMSEFFKTGPCQNWVAPQWGCFETFMNWDRHEFGNRKISLVLDKNELWQVYVSALLTKFKIHICYWYRLRRRRRRHRTKIVFSGGKGERNTHLLLKWACMGIHPLRYISFPIFNDTIDWWHSCSIIWSGEREKAGKLEASRFRSSCIEEQWHTGPAYKTVWKEKSYISSMVGWHPKIFAGGIGQKILPDFFRING